MRFMILVPANKETESGQLPSREVLEKMGAFNAEMVKAGVLLAGDGLHPTSKGARIVFNGGKAKVTDGPFSESKELIAGYWILQVKSREEAIAWISRAPFDGGATVEIRQVFSPEDFASVDPTGEIRAKEAALRAQAEAQHKG
jgi:hypothetical protein